jgi:hypothetical protein
VDKVVRLGASQTYGGRWFNIFARIKIKEGRLSITGVEGPLASGDALGSCGQIVGVEVQREASGFIGTELTTFFEVWRRYHLNDIQSACEHQRALGWTYETHKGQHCPACDYRIGSSWLKEDLPSWVMAYLEALPNTDTKPAWV